MRWPCVTGLTSYLSDRLSLCSRAATVFRAARFGRFCGVCQPRPLRVVLRSLARPRCDSEAFRWLSSTGPVPDTLVLAVAIMPPSRGTAFTGGTETFPPPLTPSASVSRPARFRAGPQPKADSPVRKCGGGATRSGRIRDHCPDQNRTCESVRRGARLPASPDFSSVIRFIFSDPSRLRGADQCLRPLRPVRS